MTSATSFAANKAALKRHHPALARLVLSLDQTRREREWEPWRASCVLSSSPGREMLLLYSLVSPLQLHRQLQLIQLPNQRTTLVEIATHILKEVTEVKVTAYFSQGHH